jgi:hypothetical protein
MLSNADLAAMRDAIEDLLPDTANILSATQASDGQGGWSTTWGTATAGVKCRLDMSRKEAFEQLAGGAVHPFSQWVLTLPNATVITEQNRVEVNSQTFNVVSVDTGKSWAASVRVTLEKV